MPPPEWGSQPPNLSLRVMTCAWTLARTLTELRPRSSESGEADLEIMGEDDGDEKEDDGEHEDGQWTGDEVRGACSRALLATDSLLVPRSRDTDSRQRLSERVLEDDGDCDADRSSNC